MDLMIIVIAAILMVPLVVFTEGLPRIILGIFFVIFFPGYTLLAVLFKRKSDIDTLTRITLSMGISLAIVVIILLALNFMPWGIRIYPILFSLLLFTGSVAGIAWWQRRRIHPAERFSPTIKLNISKWAQNWFRQSVSDKVLNSLLLLAVIGVIGTAGYVAARPAENEKFTEFYLLGLEGKAENYPHELVLGDEGRVVVCIVNHELKAVTYNLEIIIADVTAGKITGIDLEQGEKWEEQVPFLPSRAGADQKVEFCLYKQGEESPQKLHLWIDVI